MAFSIGKFNSPSNRRATRSQFEFTGAGDSYNHKILIQNKSLAKKNSILMTKISDLEVKVSDLIQQNIELRALNAKNENGRNKWLEEKLTIIEEGVSQRFEEMFQMFSAIRANEGLSPSSINLQSVLGNHSVHSADSSDRTVSFHNVKSPKKSSVTERRRKSARRQSIYIPPPSDDQPAQLSDSNNSEDAGNPTRTEQVQLQIQDALHDHIKQPSQHEETNDNNEISIHFDETNPFEDHFDSQQRFEETSQQLNDYLIPEEAEDFEEKLNEDVNLKKNAQELDNATSLSPIRLNTSQSSPSMKRSKFQVFEDSPKGDSENEVDDINAKIQKLASESIHKPIQVVDNSTNEEVANIENSSDEISDEQTPLEKNEFKVKHTKAKKSKLKSSVDEQMPAPLLDSDTLSTRKSRTRGRQVSYAEPSLRAKMRRQSAKFVDAIVDEFRLVSSAEVKKELLEASVEIESDKMSSGNETAQTKDLELNKFASIDITNKANTTKEDEYIEASRDSPIHKQSKPKSLLEKDNINITKRRKPLGNLSKNKIQKVDSNLKKPRNTIVTNNEGGDNVEDENELSVFDLVEESAVGVPKTYKGKPEISTSKRRVSRRHSMLL